MKICILVTTLLFASFSFAQLKPLSFKEANALLNATLPESIEKSLKSTPQEYSYFNDSAESTVNYSGQVMRQVLINDSKLGFLSLKMGQNSGDAKAVRAKLETYYLYNLEADGEKQYLMEAKEEDGTPTFFWEGVFYSSIFPRKINLRDKMAGVDNPLRHGKLLGWNTPDLAGAKIDKNGDNIITPAELYETMIDVTVKRASGNLKSFSVQNGGLEKQTYENAYLTEEGLDLSQLSQKLLNVALAFSQAAGDYTSVDLNPTKKKGLLADNDTLLQDRTYTTLQHHWDEFFGYFGASRNYLSYSDEQVAAGISIDSYESEDVEDPATGGILYTNQIFGEGDGQISISGEKNFGMSINAAKRDMGAKLKNVDLSKNIFSSLLKGRHLIQEKPEGYLKYAQAHAVVAVHEWEKVLATTAIHYINVIIEDLKSYGSNDFSFADMAKHWSELKGFALGAQFNPNSVFMENGTADFEQLHLWIGDRPVNPATENVQTYLGRLLKARDMMGKKYGFDQENLENW